MELPGLTTTTYTIIYDENGLVKSQSSSEQVTRKPSPPPDLFSFKSLLANILKGPTIREKKRQMSQSPGKQTGNGVPASVESRVNKSARGDLRLFIPTKRTINAVPEQKSQSKLTTVLKNCSEVQASLMPIWQRASSTVTTKREELAETKQVLAKAYEEINIWKANATYKTGRVALEQELKKRESLADKDDKELLDQLLGVQSQHSGAKKLDTLNSIRSLRLAQKLRRLKRPFGQRFSAEKIMTSEPQTPIGELASPKRVFESEEQALLREIKEYRLSEFKVGAISNLEHSSPKSQAVSPTKEPKITEPMNDLNRYIFKARGKYHSKSISDLNTKRRVMLEAKMERIAPSPEVLRKALVLMEKERQRTSLKATRIDNLKSTPFSKMISTWVRKKHPEEQEMMEDLQKRDLKEQSKLEHLFQRSKKKKEIMENARLMAK